MQDLNYLKEAAQAATPGPWYVQYGDDGRHQCMTAISTTNERSQNMGMFGEEPLVAVTFHQSYPPVNLVGDDCGENDSKYIAAASPDVILALIAELEQLRAAKAEIVEEALALHRKMSAETLRADAGWDRYEQANKARNALLAEKVSAASAKPVEQKPAMYCVLFNGEFTPNAYVTLQRAEQEKRILDLNYPDDVRAIAPLYAAPQAPVAAVQGYKLVPLEPTPEIIRAMASSRAVDDEGEFPLMLDLLDFSGENKTDTVLKAAWHAAIAAAPEVKP